jgi:hypothetical protein
LTPSGGRNRYVVIALVAVLATGGIVVLSLGNPSHSGTNGATTSSSSAPTANLTSKPASSSSNDQPFLNASGVYASLGYPKVDYSPDYQEITDYSFNFGDPPYVPGEPSFNWEIPSPGGTYTAGTIHAPVLDLDQAVNLAAVHAKLDPVNYTLAEAVFAAGTVYKSSPQSFPEWTLYFAEVHDGYWVYDQRGPGAFSVEVVVDASNGTVTHMEVSPSDMTGLLNSQQYNLGVNATGALEAVRSSNSSGAPPGLIQNGTVISIAPRLALLGSSPSSWLNGSLQGEGRLLWIIGLDRETDCCEQDGVFAVDAGTGELVSESFSVGIGIPNVQGESSGSLVFPSARGMSVSNETFESNGSIIDRPGLVSVEVPHVLIAKPGSSSSILLDYSTSNLSSPFNITLSFANPTPSIQNLSSNGNPPGVSLQFSKPNLVLPRNGAVSTAFLISVAGNAAAGTYLIELAETSIFPGSGTTQTNEVLLFYLSVWNGAGEWPPPPQWPLPEQVYTIEGFSQTYHSLAEAQSAAATIFPPGAAYRVDLNSQIIGTFQVP